MSQVILMTAYHPLPQFASGERRIPSPLPAERCVWRKTDFP